MKPFNEAAEGLKAKARVMIDDARDQELDNPNPARRSARFKRAEKVTWTERSFHYDDHHKMWNVQGVTGSKQRTIFTEQNGYCTCHDFHIGNAICKHLISLASEALKYLNKQGE